MWLKLILTFFIFKTVNNQTIKLTVQNLNSFNGPKYMGVNLGHAGLGSNWLKFMERLGVNAARLFVSGPSGVKASVSSSLWGQDLNGNKVTNQSSYLAAVTRLRSPDGRNQTYKWKNPIGWSNFTSAMLTYTDVSGSTDNTVQGLNLLNITKLFVLNIGCTSSGFVFTSMDRNLSVYWSERWELYKFSYVLAVYASNYGVSVVEFMNEPDLLLGGCLNASLYLEYYLIRSQSIQDAFSDCNSKVQIAASAFARGGFGGDLTKYLGDVSINNTNFLFSSYAKTPSWSNMQLYSYHSYGKTGDKQVGDFESTVQSVNSANPTSTIIPVIITEHNSHTSGDWCGKNSTVDDNFEASRLASQILNLASSTNILSHFVFKFSVTPSSNNVIAKNGIHWGENNIAPYHIADSTLSAEAFRLLTQLKGSIIYPVSSNDTNNTISRRTYLASSNNNGIYYLYIVNDNQTSTNVSFDFTSWAINDSTWIPVETVSSNYWGEVSNIIKSKTGYISLDPYSTTRLTIQTGLQKMQTSNAVLACTARAGSNCNLNDCSNFIYSGTSYSSSHESTSVSILSFPLLSLKNNQRAILKLMVSTMSVNKTSYLTVLGIRNSSALNLNNNSASWNSLPTLLNPLASGTAISSISQNFVNWNSSANFYIAGHFLVNQISNQLKRIDVTDYVNQVISLGGNQLTFLIYRPFRHPFYNTTSPVLADDLSQGSIVKFYGVNSTNPSSITYFYTA